MTPITNCRACESKNLTDFLDLGSQYLSDFRDDDSKTPTYPLVSTFCEDCKLVQLRHTTPQPEMYHDRYGFKSGISDSIKADLNDIVTHAFQYQNNPGTWLDIASNDGTLLSFVPTDVYRVGVDPVEFLCKEAEQHANKIVNDYFGNYAFDGTFDVITSISCFYDMPDPNKFVTDVKKVLGAKGVWVIQQNYLLSTIELSAVDNICHEHLEYYTLLSLENLLEKHGLEVNEVQVSSVNGGSIRTVVSHKGARAVDETVEAQRAIEEKAGLDSIEAYKNFAESVTVELKRLKALVEVRKSLGDVIYVLAASTRGATIWQSADIGAKQITYAVERNPAKVGRWFSAIGVKIISEEEATANQPDMMIVGPWFFAKEIVTRERDYVMAGGKLCIPLPVVKVIGRTNIDTYLSDLAANI